MKKNIPKLILLSLFSYSILFSANASNKIIQSPKKVSETFEYDATKGWWWYKEKYVKDNKEFVTKTKMTTKEKIKKDTEEEKIRLLKEQNKKLAIIKERLEYAFPNITPIYTKNSKTGKKCLTNSSSDCFVFPLQAEAQHVPVMAKWLSNPTPENSKQWLKWQAKYFNHVTNIGYGNKFAYLSGGSKAYPTDNYFNNGDSLAFSKTAKWVLNRELDILKSLKNKITILVFLAKTPSLDYVVRVQDQFYHWNSKNLKDISFYFIFENQKSLDIMKNFIKTRTTNTNIQGFENIFKSGHVVVKPEYFKKFNISITPSVVITYLKDKKKGEKDKNFIWQKTMSGDIDPSGVIKSTYQFLVYNKIIKPEELSNDKSIIDIHKGVNLKPKVDESKIYKSTNSIKIK